MMGELLHPSIMYNNIVMIGHFAARAPAALHKTPSSALQTSARKRAKTMLEIQSFYSVLLLSSIASLGKQVVTKTGMGS